MKKAIVLLSGGLDSTTCLAIAQHQQYDCYGLSFDYGQRHQTELEAARCIASKFGIKRHEIVALNLSQFGGSALTDHDIPVPDYSDSNTIPTTYVPARNTIFLAIAMGFAETVGAETIFIGCSAIDYSGYPDCRPEYIHAFQRMAELATKEAVSGKPVSIAAPLLHLSKAETIQLGVKLGVDYKMTISCYQANSKGEACGQCDSCVLRRQGFSDAKLSDPTSYDNAAVA